MQSDEAAYWKKHNYEFVETADGSPTLRWLSSPTEETMHHRGGAYSETQLIYGEPLRDVLLQGGKSILSVGLGLGYNEILVAFEALSQNISPMTLQLLSFESEEVLKTQLQRWLQAPDSDSIYDQIFEFFAADYPILKAEVKRWLQQALESQNWQLAGALDPEVQLSQKFECIFYDAFSSKTSPFLWEEHFLKFFFNQASAPVCQISTYACTGALKRALKETGFQVVLREGFQSKRNSALGIRK